MLLSPVRCCAYCDRRANETLGEIALSPVGLMRWLLLGEGEPPLGRAKAVGEGVFRPLKVGEAGLAEPVGEGVLRFLSAAVASAEGVTGNERGVAIVWSPCDTRRGHASEPGRRAGNFVVCVCVCEVNPL